MHAGRLRTMFLCTVGSGALFLGACSTSNTIPATAPDTTAATTTTVATTTTSTSTSTTTAPTTTLDRKAEIEAIFQDLEQRRLTALYEGDQKAFRALFANDAYRRRSMEALELAEFDGRPTDVRLSIVEVAFDSTECVAAVVETDYSAFLLEGALEVSDFVVERVDDGWGYSWIGEGWRCEGPHPLES